MAYSFRVSGTNRTLNQPVSFIGTYFPGTNSILSSLGQITAKDSSLASFRRTQTNQPAKPAGMPSRVLGRAKVGNQELDVNAVGHGP